MKKSIISYIYGFFLSAFLTVGAYLLVVSQFFRGNLLVVCILISALLQLTVQLYFFLHLGREPKNNWNLVFFITTAALILVIVIGSIWIMHNLNYRMTPQQIHNYLQNQNGF